MDAVSTDSNRSTNMRRRLILGVFALVAATGGFVAWRGGDWRHHRQAGLIEEVWHKEPRTSLTPVPGSVSPDGEWHLVQFYYGETTGEVCMVLTNARGDFGGVLEAETESDYRPDSRYHNGCVLLWSPDSRRFALHDRKPKHSIVRIFGVTEAGLRELPVTGLRERAMESEGFHGEAESSGQQPIRWVGPDVLTVEVGAKFPGGRTVATSVHLRLSDECATPADL
jgi:hypothetical protein